MVVAFLYVYRAGYLTGALVPWFLTVAIALTLDNPRAAVSAFTICASAQIVFLLVDFQHCQGILVTTDVVDAMGPEPYRFRYLGIALSRNLFPLICNGLL
jgi:hypothetical protein